MNAEEIDQSLEELMADHRLMELCELQRTGDEVLDVISLSENQHSDILAWLLDAREGHGQGDEILRDLLLSASIQAASGRSGLDGRGTTAKFFAAWPPSRIRTTSFGASFTARELGITAAERVDLFVIDAQNKFILLLENKAGAKHSQRQLDLYRSSFQDAVAQNPRLREFHQVYLALDREFDGEDAASRPASSSWLHLGYDWLKVSAKRALMHVGRGNVAARLVVSYCNRQTDWESPSNESCLQLAADLHQAYPEAVKTLVSSSRGRVEREWLTSTTEREASFQFVLQNKGAVAFLRETQGMASVKSAILKRLPELPQESVEHKRMWLDMCPAGWEQFEGDEWWPVFINVRYSNEERSKYSVTLSWNGDNARTADEAEKLRLKLTKVEPLFGKRIDSRWRRVVVRKGMDLPETLLVLVDLNARLKKVLDEHHP